MKVSVEFFAKEHQKSSESDPLPIATWRFGPIPKFPYRGMITEIHDIGMSVATGMRLKKKHEREVWLTSEAGGYVQPCQDRTCWDQRRFGSRLYKTESIHGKMAGGFLW